MTLTETLLANKLQVVLTSVVVVSVGGAATYVALTGGLLAGDEMLEAVPAEADTVMHVDGAVTEDETTRALVEAFIDVAAAENESYDGPADFADARAEAENQSELSLDGFRGLTAFGRYPEDGEDDGTEYGAAIIDSDWDTEAFVDATADGSAYEQRSYEGYTVYVVEDEAPDAGEADADAGGEFESQVGPDGGFGSASGGFDAEASVDTGPTWIAVLDDGRYASGSERAVKDAVDVDRGAAAAIGGDLRSAYESTPDGYVRFAGTIPADADEANLSAAEDAASMSGLGGFDNLRRLRNLLDVQSYAGAYYTDEDTVGYQFRLAARNGDTADDLEALFSGTITASEYTIPPNETAALFDDLTVEREGSDVVMTFESTPTAIAEGHGSLVDFVENMTLFPTGEPSFGDSYGESVYGNGTYDDWGNSTYDDWGNSTYDDWGNSTYDDWGNSTYDDWGNSSSEGWGDSTSEGWGDSTSEGWGDDTDGETGTETYAVVEDGSVTRHGVASVAPSG